MDEVKSDGGVELRMSGNRGEVYLKKYEPLNNPDFNSIEFDRFRKEAGLNSFTLKPKPWIAIKENLIPVALNKKQVNQIYASEADIRNMALFRKTAAQWRVENPDKTRNIRDYANVFQLVCMFNFENFNAVFIDERVEQAKRLIRLNRIAIQQMRILVEDRITRRLEGK